MNKLQLQSIVASRVLSKSKRDLEDSACEMRILEQDGQRTSLTGKVYRLGVNAPEGFELPNPAPPVLNKSEILKQMGQFMQNRFDPYYPDYKDFLSIIVRHTRLEEYINKLRV